MVTSSYERKFSSGTKNQNKQTNKPNSNIPVNHIPGICLVEIIPVVPASKETQNTSATIKTFYIMCLILIFWLIDYIWFGAPLESISFTRKHHNCSRRAARFNLGLCLALWSLHEQGVSLCCATPAVTRGLGFTVSSGGPPPPFTRLVRQVRGIKDLFYPTLTQIPTGIDLHNSIHG